MVNGHGVDVWRAEALLLQHHVEYPDSVVAIKINVGMPLKDFIRLFDTARASGLPARQIAIL